MSSVKSTRMKAEDRRELLLEAATVVFGDRGYHGATTDAIAQAAGVSQPYVVRLFGTKERLFLEVMQRAVERLMAAFHAALAGDGPAPASGRRDRAALMGAAYGELLADRGLLLSLMHGFLLGADPVIGPRIRAGFGQVYGLLRDEAGFTAEEAREFLAQGMLLNTLIGIQLVRDYDTDPEIGELIDCVAPTKVALLRQLGAA